MFLKYVPLQTTLFFICCIAFIAFKFIGADPPRNYLLSYFNEAHECVGPKMTNHLKPVSTQCSGGPFEPFEAFVIKKNCLVGKILHCS